MIKINAAARLKAEYEGTKVKDLATYVKSLCPSAKFSSSPPMKSGQLVAIVQKADALRLGKALMSEGWKKRRIKRILNTQEAKIYNVFTPSNSEDTPIIYVPAVRLSEPSSSGKVSVHITQGTAMSVSENRKNRA
jgi:hypothetical protein